MAHALFLLLALCALVAMPVRAGSVAFLHKLPPGGSVASAIMAADAPCPMHQDMGVGDEDDSTAKPAPHVGKGAGACCVAWCVSPALPVALMPLRFPPPSIFLLPTGLLGPEGRQDSPPLRPPRA